MTATAGNDAKPLVPPVLRLVGVTKTFGSFAAVDAVDLDIRQGEFFTIVGPSGSGKTTLLRMLAGLDRPNAGDILLRGVCVNDVPANRRPTAMVFQSLALFQHKTVGQNIEFALKMRGAQPAVRRARAHQLMDMLRLPREYYGRSVARISGGERQRVALARALASDPEILFFDEPLSAIDYRLRKQLEVELKDLHRETGKTFVYITHSLEEAMVMSDRIGIMRQGQLIQIGTPDEIYTRPLNKFVSEFMGEVNVIEVEVRADGHLDARGLDRPLKGPALPAGMARGHLVVRPESVRFLENGAGAENVVAGELYNEYALGSRVQYHVKAGPRMFVVEKLREQRQETVLGARVTIGWDARDSIVVPD
jgi:spermidine/putrescine transport system ATP-binding protein